MRTYLLKIFFMLILVFISAPRNADGSIPESDFIKLKPIVDNGIDAASEYNGSALNLGYSERSVLEPAEKVKMLLLAAANGENNNVQYMVSGNSTRDNSFNEMIDYYTEQFRKINVELIDNACSGQTCKAWISGEGGYPTDLSDAISATNGNGENTIMEFSYGLNDWKDIDTTNVSSFKRRFAHGIGLYLDAKPEATVILTVPVTTGWAERGVVLTQVYKELADELGLLLVDVTVATVGVHGNSAYYGDNTHPNKWGSRRIVNYITDQILPSELYSVMTLTEAPKQDGWMSIEDINAGLHIRLKIDYKSEMKQLLYNAAIGINNDVKYIVSGSGTRDNSFNEMIAYYEQQFAKINVELIDNASDGQSCHKWINNIGSYDSYLSDAIAASDGEGENTILEFSFGDNSWDQPDIKAKLKEGINLYRDAKPEAIVILVTPLARDDKDFQNDLSKIYEELSTELGLTLIDGVFCTKDVHGNSKYYKDGTHPNKWGSRRIVNYITDQILPSELYSGMTLTEAPQQTGWLSIDEINIGLNIRLKKNIHLPNGTELINNNYFDYDLSDWGLNGESLAKLSIDFSSELEGKNSALVHVNNTSSNSWKIQLRQIIDGGIKEGKTYHIQFMAKSNKTVSNISAVIQQIHGSFSDIYSKEISLEANTKVTIVDTFVCKETDELVEWSFNLGTASVNDVDIWFDTVHLIELDEEVSVEEENRMPVKFELSQNYPNPFNPTTIINFSLRTEGMTKLVVYNILGQQVKVLLNENMQVGSYSIPFVANNLTSGVYYYKLQSNNKIEIKKMLLIK